MESVGRIPRHKSEQPQVQGRKFTHPPPRLGQEQGQPGLGQASSSSSGSAISSFLPIFSPMNKE